MMFPLCLLALLVFPNYLQARIIFQASPYFFSDSPKGRTYCIASSMLFLLVVVAAAPPLPLAEGHGDHREDRDRAREGDQQPVLAREVRLQPRGAAREERGARRGSASLRPISTRIASIIGARSLTAAIA